jgi:hypothetical protein
MNNPYFYSRLFLLSVIILLLQACQKNNSNNNDTGEYVVKEVHAYGELTSSNEYNDTWKLIKSTNVEHVNARTRYTIDISYFYNNDGRLERTEFTSTGPTVNQPATIEYTYNNQGRLTATKALRKNGDLLSKDEYDYNGQTITATHSIDTVYYVTTYTVDGRGNIVKAAKDDHTPGNNDYTEEWQDFDDKKNVGGPRVGDVSSKNNPRRYIFYYARPGSTNEILMTYTYNGAGYVTEYVLSLKQ